jgi:hypothetical protein
MIFFYVFAEKDLGIISVVSIWQQLTTKTLRFYASNFTVIFVTTERLKKAVTKITARAKDITQRFLQQITTKIMRNYARQNISVKNVTKNLKIELDYGGIKRNV